MNCVGMKSSADYERGKAYFIALKNPVLGFFLFVVSNCGRIFSVKLFLEITSSIVFVRWLESNELSWHLLSKFRLRLCFIFRFFTGFISLVRPFRSWIFRMSCVAFLSIFL